MTTTALSRSARPTRLGRIADYLGEMFPPLVYIPYGLATFCAIWFSTQALAGVEVLRLTGRSIAAGVTVVLFLLLLRVYDELKDVETDLRLGRAGDPRYKDRAIVTGRIEVGDLVFLRWFVTAALFALNLPLGAPLPLVPFLVTFAITWCSFKWFFWEAVSKNLLLAFITHNPMTLLLVVYVVSVYAAEFGTDAVPSGLWPVALAAWLPVAAWETSRKVRRPEDETDYQTYSKMLGHRVAASLPALLVAGASASLLIIAHRTGLSLVYSAIVALAALTVAGACVRFIVRPTTQGANLKPYTETFSLVATLGLTIALVVSRGLTFGAP